MAPDPDKVKAVQEWKRPISIIELRAFLGFIGYYRRFIENVAKIATPLHQLLCGAPKKSKIPFNLSEWTEDSETAFQRLKGALLLVPILAFADFYLPFYLVYRCQ